MPKEYYELLGVSEDASQDEIKKAYREKAKQYHPDSNSEHASEEKFKKINKAYDVLSDEEKRKKYDRFGKAGVDAQARGAPGGGQGFGGFQDLFESIFGGMGGSMGGGRGRRREEQGQDLRIPLTVTLEEAYEGVEKTFSVSRKKRCDACDGSGAKGGNTTTCSTCNGQGRVQSIEQTLFGRARTVQECPDCNGRGERPETACTQCRGDGVVEADDTISVDVPAGVETGQRLRIRGKGHTARNGNTGDLYVFVDVEDHDGLERRNNDLFTTVRIGIGDAVLGGTVEVPTATSTLEVNVPQGTQPGQVLRVEDKGMPVTKRKNRFGDLYVKVDVHIPDASDVTTDQQDVLEQLRETAEQEKSFFETVKDIVS